MRLRKSMFVIALLLLAVSGCSRLPEEEAPVDYCSASTLSPDGRYMALGNPDGVLDLETGELARLRDNDVTSALISWELESRTFVFPDWFEDGPPQFVRCTVPEIQCEQLDSSALEESSVMLPYPLVHVKDAKVIVALRPSWEGPPALAVAKIDQAKMVATGQRVELSETSEFGVTWMGRSRDGRHALAVLEDAMFAVNASTLDTVRLLDKKRVAALTGTAEEAAREKGRILDREPDISGKELVLRGGRILDVAPGIGGGWVYCAVGWFDVDTLPVFVRINLSTAEVQKLRVMPKSLPNIAVDPDGERIAFAEFAGEVKHDPRRFWSNARSRICVSDYSLADIQALTSGEYTDRLPVWNEARGEIIFRRDQREIWAVPIEGGEPRRIWGLD